MGRGGRAPWAADGKLALLLVAAGIVVAPVECLAARMMPGRILVEGTPLRPALPVALDQSLTVRTMPIAVHLDLMLVKRKMSLTDLSRATGLALANLSILKTNKARAVRFTTLAALCRVLECQPADLLSYQPGAGGEPTLDQ